MSPLRTEIIATLLEILSDLSPPYQNPVYAPADWNNIINSLLIVKMERTVNYCFS